MDILWAAIGGAVGGVLGSLVAAALSRLAPQKWRRGIVTGIAIATGIIGGRVGASFYENQALAPASVEAQLLADHDSGPLLQTWKDADPHSYQALVSRLSEAARAGQDFSSLVNIARAQMEVVAKPRFAHLDDAHTVEVIHVARAEFAQLSTSHPETCKPMFMGDSFGDITPYISADIRSRELGLLQAAFRADMNAPQNALSGQALNDAISSLVAATHAVVGDDTSLLANGANITGHERRYCEVVVALYEQLEAMPSAQAASLLRGMRAAS